jgi:hypothetical protein
LAVPVTEHEGEELWWRHSEPALARLRSAIGVFAAEREAGALRRRALAELHAYDGGPLDAWFDRVVDRYCAERIPGST